MDFPRELDLSQYSSSILLLGPRLTGKTTLLSKYQADYHLDLLDPEIRLDLNRSPKKFWQSLESLGKGALVIVDEIQKIPLLLDYVQMGIDRFGQRFILSGSSARKLKRGAANLLGGRAIEMRMYPLSFFEVGEKYSIQAALQYGTLPKICDLYLQGKLDEVRAVLKSYYTIYLKEEVQEEALVRDLASFQRFFDVAAQMNGEEVQYSNIAASSQVPASSVKQYFAILEDTLVANRLWQWQKSEKDKSKPKLYFFDCGVVNSIKNRLIDPLTSREKGALFETYIYNQLLKIRDYHNKPDKFSYWSNGKGEVDFLIERNGQVILAIECKTGRIELPQKLQQDFYQKFPKTPLLVAHSEEKIERKLGENVKLMPYQEVLRMYLDL